VGELGDLVPKRDSSQSIGRPVRLAEGGGSARPCATAGKDGLGLAPAGVRLPIGVVRCVGGKPRQGFGVGGVVEPGGLGTDLVEQTMKGRAAAPGGLLGLGQDIPSQADLAGGRGSCGLHVGGMGGESGGVERIGL
jgi:hypothetical protein